MNSFKHKKPPVWSDPFNIINIEFYLDAISARAGAILLATSQLSTTETKIAEPLIPIP